jgi:hypothetical protein
MKTAFNFFFFVLFGTIVVISRGQTASVPPPTPYTIVSRSMSERVWQRFVYELSPSGQAVPRTQKYTELSDGICYYRDGKWFDSQDAISILPDGSACATNGPTQAFFPIDLADGKITLVSPEGLQITEQPAALCYDDGSNTVILAVLTNSVGQLVAPNKAIYTNALFGLNADILYTYRNGGLEQDVILHEQPPNPRSLNLNPQTTSLKILTQFFNPPQPAITSINVQTPAGQATDENLEFGSIKMIPGKAFLLGTNEASVTVTKQWIQLNGKQFLIESVPMAALSEGLSTLPPASARRTPRGRLRDLLTTLRPAHHASGKNRGRISASRAASPTSGLAMDFVTLTGGLTNYVFQGDSTYYISSGGVTLYGTNTFDGGSVIKYTNGASISIVPEVMGQGLVWNSQTALPVIFTAKDDNSVGSTVSGSTGTPTGYYANPALNLIFTTAPEEPISNFRFAYAQQAVSLGGVPPAFYDGQILDCLGGFSMDGGNELYLRNILFADVNTNLNNLYSAIIDAQNCTFRSSTNLATIENQPSQTDLLYFTNCIFANVLNLTNNYGSGINCTLTANNNGFYDAPAFGSATFTSLTYPFETAGAGGDYLTNGCEFRGVGTTNIDPALLADLATRTTWVPLVYCASNISFLGTLGPTVPRDISSTPDCGYHYSCLDYVFAGCDLYSNLTFTAGTAVGWFETNGSDSGQPYAISLNGGANLTFNGNATQPCIFARYPMVQEGENGNWTGDGWVGAIMFNGGSPEPQLSANFTKVTSDMWNGNIFRDIGGSPTGAGAFRNSEFYDFTFSTFNMTSLSFTNCLFFRFNQSFWTSPALAFENCTFYNGGMYAGRSSPVTWLIENSSFDGTALAWSDSYNGTSYTSISNNAYNTNNLSWTSYPYFNGYTIHGTNEVVGQSDLMVTNFNWQISWFGNFYLPPASGSPLIDAGSTYANLLGLYHFTTQTNQTVEGDSIVDIGYHYVATDQYGNPLDSNGDGIPDYLEDPSGAGILGPQITLAAPNTGSFYIEPATIPIQATVSDWSGLVTNVDLLQSNAVQGTASIISITNVPYTYSWPIVAAGQYALTGLAQDSSGLSATSAVVNVTVTNLCGF